MLRVKGAQGSAQWVTARCGIPTASRFDKILTNVKLDLSKSAVDYMAELLAEWFEGQPVDDLSETPEMQRGTELEPLARKSYAMETGHTVDEVGLCLTDDGLIGCSPDGLIGDDGMLEIKTPMMKQHIAYMINPAKLAAKYRLQVHGGLFVCERDWIEIVSYHPSLPNVIVHVGRADDVNKEISRSTADFCFGLGKWQRQFQERGITPNERPFEVRKRIVGTAE